MSKTLKKRKAPSASATKFSVGTKKKGNDGNTWEIVKNKKVTFIFFFANYSVSRLPSGAAEFAGPGSGGAGLGPARLRARSACPTPPCATTRRPFRPLAPRMWPRGCTRW